MKHAKVLKNGTQLSSLSHRINRRPSPQRELTQQPTLWRGLSLKLNGHTGYHECHEPAIGHNNANELFEIEGKRSK